MLYVWVNFFLAFGISLLFIGLIVWLSRTRFGFLVGNDVIDGPQKFHQNNILRSGGVGITTSVEFKVIGCV